MAHAALGDTITGAAKKHPIVAIALGILALIVATGIVTVAQEHPVENSSTTRESTGYTPPQFQLTQGEAQNARDELESLTVQPKNSNMAEYTGNREALFGPAWTDTKTSDDLVFANNGCSTRDDILDRDLQDVTKKDDCVVTSGKLWDPYTGQWIDFKRGKSTSSAVQIDHVIALGNAWVSGADQLTEQQRIDLANDPINLVAVDGPTNGAKGDKDAADWLPPNEDIHCFYAASQVRVKARYDLSVTQEEKDALNAAMRTCPGGI